MPGEKSNQKDERVLLRPLVPPQEDPSREQRDFPRRDLMRKGKGTGRESRTDETRRNAFQECRAACVGDWMALENRFAEEAWGSVSVPGVDPKL